MRNDRLLKRLERIRNMKKPAKYSAGFPDLKMENSHELSNNLKSKGGFKLDKTKEHLWKRGKEEKPETVKQIEIKAKRIRPHFSKGGYSYATDGDNQGEIRIHRK